MRECVKCKSNDYTNKNLVMMINECGHPLCKNCVDNLYARNAAPCHICGKTLRKNNFWPQIFDDPLIEKENNIRRRLRKVYNLKMEDFPSVREFNDYLERVEFVIANLAAEIDIEETEAEIASFKEINVELIERNRKKLDADQMWVLQHLKDDKDMKDRLNNAHQQDTEEQHVSAVKDSRAIIEELRQSDETAETILDRERKRQIEIDLEEKEKAAERKRRNKEMLQGRKRAAETMSFATAQRLSGRNYEYQPIQLLLGGPAIPELDDLEAKGYLQHIKRPSTHRVAGGFTAQTGCMRALFESRIDLFAY